MSVQNVASALSLPRSYYFITISRGTAMRTLAFRSLSIHALLCLVSVLALWSVGATVYLVFHDDLVSALLARQTRMQYGYEDRIAALRNEIDQQTSRHSADQARLDGRMHDLFSREARLESRAEIVAGLAGRAGAMHDRSPNLALSVPSRPMPRLDFMTDPGKPPSLPADVMDYAGPTMRLPKLPFAVAKPHPEAESLFEPAPSKPPGSVAIDPADLPISARLSVLAATLDRVEHVQTDSLAEIDSAARARTARLRDVLAEVGLAPERFGHIEAPVGGPFVSVPPDASSTFDHAVAALRDTMEAELHLNAALSHVPLAAPLAGSPEVTSPFGTRIDPFLGRLALHTGVDLREDYGVDVRTTAAGRVTTAASSGGYGNMVEVDHGNGLRTRYAHLSEIDVVDGQSLPVGGIVGRVGATGRATGPHLHYEVRIDGEPVDPVQFLSAGLHLAVKDP